MAGSPVLLCILFSVITLTMGVVPLAMGQLSPSETRVLFQIQKQLEYPEALQGWTNWTGFCYLPASPSLTIACFNNHVTELTIVGTKNSSSGDGLNPDPTRFAVSQQTLSASFSIDSLFTVLTRLSNLTVLSLVSLGLWGPLPAKVSRLHSLVVLNLSSNSIYGEIPQSITSFKSLRSLVLSGNLFNGSVPDLKGLPVLEELNLGDNFLGPEFPLFRDTLVSVLLRNNSFRSEIPSLLNGLGQLQRLDVSANGLSGHVPSFIFRLPSIRYLSLEKNQLSGALPTNLSCSVNLTYVDISLNHLVGNLPSCIGSSSPNRTVISSWNCLSGGNLKYQHSYSYCQKEALAVEPPAKAQKQGSSIKLSVVLGIIGGTLGIAGAFGLLVIVLIRKAEARRSFESKPAESYADELSFRGSPKSSIDSRRMPQTMRLATLGLPPYHVFTLEEIDDATNSFDPCNLMGEANQGQIYKGWLRDGTVVLVKRLKLKQRSLPQNVVQQLDNLSKLRHRHLVGLLGHCIVTYHDHPNVASTVFIVLEHISNGSLANHITDWRRKEMLKWPQRMAISIGVARGIQFLHTGMAPGIFGNDLNIDNVLLDESLTAKISNYNIPLPFKMGSKIESNDSSPKDAEREDMYQLGKILLQIITGKLVKSTCELDDMKQLLEKSLTEHPSQLRSAVDPSIRGTFAYQSLKTAVEVTVNCLTEEPSQRPSIEDVLWNLQYSIQVQEGWTSSENLSTRA
ncbi:Protein kinase domain-containing protein [Psidium guajava]|nr:Protein kinase domain-containing protein [Psidium guajava]